MTTFIIVFVGDDGILVCRRNMTCWNWSSYVLFICVISFAWSYYLAKIKLKFCYIILEVLYNSTYVAWYENKKNLGYLSNVLCHSVIYTDKRMLKRKGDEMHFCTCHVMSEERNLSCMIFLTTNYDELLLNFTWRWNSIKCRWKEYVHKINLSWIIW